MGNTERSFWKYKVEAGIHSPTLQRQPTRWALWTRLVFNNFQVQPRAPMSLKGHMPYHLPWNETVIFCSFLSCKYPTIFHPILVFGHALPSPEIPLWLFLVSSFQSFTLPIKSTSSHSGPRKHLPHRLSPIQKHSQSRSLVRALLWEAFYGLFQGTPGIDVANADWAHRGARHRAKLRESISFNLSNKRKGQCYDNPHFTAETQCLVVSIGVDKHVCASYYVSLS